MVELLSGRAAGENQNPSSFAASLIREPAPICVLRRLQMPDMLFLHQDSGAESSLALFRISSTVSWRTALLRPCPDDILVKNQGLFAFPYLFVAFDPHSRPRARFRGRLILDQKDPVSLRCDFDTSTNASAIETADLVEISGRVKWFDAAKGYGFVVPDNGTSDVLLHIVTLRKDGFKTAYEGARIVCEAIRRAKGLQVLKIVSMDGPGAMPPSEWRPSRARAEMMAVGGFQIAIVKWFNRTRGFGFLTQGEGTQDIFVHMETLRRYGIGELRPGESLLVRYGDGPKGLMAAEVRPLDLAMPAPH